MGEEEHCVRSNAPDRKLDVKAPPPGPNIPDTRLAARETVFSRKNFEFEPHMCNFEMGNY